MFLTVAEILYFLYINHVHYLFINLSLNQHSIRSHPFRLSIPFHLKVLQSSQVLEPMVQHPFLKQILQVIKNCITVVTQLESSRVYLHQRCYLKKILFQYNINNIIYKVDSNNFGIDIFTKS